MCFIELIVKPIFYLLDYLVLIIIPEGIPREIIKYEIYRDLVIARPIHNCHYLKRKKRTLTFSFLKMSHI